MTYLSVVFILWIHSFDAVVCYIDLTNTYSIISPLKKTSFCSSIFILLIYADRENLFNYMVLLNIRDKIIIVPQPEINRFALHLVLNINISTHIHIIKVSLLFLQYTHLKKKKHKTFNKTKFKIVFLSIMTPIYP